MDSVERELGRGGHGCMSMAVCEQGTRYFLVLKMTEIYEKVSFRGTGGQRRLADRLCLERQIGDLNRRRGVNKAAEK